MRVDEEAGNELKYNTEMGVSQLEESSGRRKCEKIGLAIIFCHCTPC